MQTYFELMISNEARWHINVSKQFADGSPVDVWSYSRGCWIENTRPLILTKQIEGLPVDYNPTVHLITIVSRRMADLIESVSSPDIQRISALFEGVEGLWEVVNILPTIDCINHNASTIQYYPATHPTKPNKPRGVIQLVLDSRRIGDHHIFRPQGWHVATVISGNLKDVFEKTGITGLEYIPIKTL